MTKKMEAKLQRLGHANSLIQIIAAHGRQFFFCNESQRVAELAIDARGRIWFIDARTQRFIYTHETGRTNHWRSFSHGGTLRGLVEMMRDYIVQGDPIPGFYIGPRRLSDNSNIWGYEEEAMEAVRAAAAELPIIEAKGEGNEQ